MIYSTPGLCPQFLICGSQRRSPGLVVRAHMQQNICTCMYTSLTSMNTYIQVAARSVVYRVVIVGLRAGSACAHAEKHIYIHVHMADFKKYIHTGHCPQCCM